MMKIIFYIVACSMAAAALLTILLLNAGDEGIVHSQLSVSSALSGNDTAGYKRALHPVEFKFPGDHGPHAEFKTEWWYYTGNLHSAGGRRFGYQLTLFRTALSPYFGLQTSAWRTNAIFMGHFTITDVEDNKFYFYEKFSRQAGSLANAAADPFHLKIYNWTVSGNPDGIGQTGGNFHISAEDNGAAINLMLINAKPLVLQGEKGFSRKGHETGNASYYYSFTRLKTEGTVRIKNQEFNVAGFSWMDREWSTSSLSKEQAGWDWFSLQLNDNTELMYYRLRKKDGSEDQFSSCRIIDKEGNVKKISPAQISLRSTDTFETNEGIKYPAGWILEIKKENITFVIRPYVKDQELRTSVRYWEGAVSVTGTSQGRQIQGSGYVELTGYGKSGIL